MRTNVGIVDVSTLGKIELQGRDVAELLNRVYINHWDTLAVGRCRYGVMLRDDGIVLDDGTTSRLSATHYLMTTTTVNAVKVMQQLEYLLQAEWPELEVFATSVTEQWAAAALSGPKLARSRLPGSSTSTSRTRRFRSSRSARATCARRADSIPARLFRMSYSGELAYEIHVPADRGRAMWEAVDRGGRAVRPHAVRHRSDEHAAHREGPRRDRRRGRRPHDGRRPRHGQARQRRASGASASRCSNRAGVDRAGSLAARRADRARRRANAARREDRRRSRSCGAEPDAGPRDVVVLHPEPRCMDRAGAPRRRSRASRRNAVGGVAAGRLQECA